MAKVRAGRKALVGVPQPDDDELMNRYQHDQDAGALEQLFARHKDMLLRYITRLVRDVTAAEDAFQQSWLKVIEAGRKRSYVTHPEAAFRTWLFTLARNHVIDEHQRKQKSRRSVTLPQAADSDLGESCDDGYIAVDPADEAIQRDLTERIISAVRLLPGAQREVITLWAAGFDPHEIATMLGAPRQTVLSRKKYALAKLRTSALAMTPLSRTQSRR